MNSSPPQPARTEAVEGRVPDPGGASTGSARAGLGAVYPSLRDRVVFVSGASSGIGAELVRAFSAQGARVAFCGLAGDGGEAVVEAITAAGHIAPWFAPCDVRDIPAYQGLLADVAARLGPIRVLVNNAGRDDRHAMEEVTPEYWDDRLAVNLKHHFFAIQAVAPGMAAAGGGSVINMGSVSWMRGRPHLAGYTTAKAGILGLTRTLARELGGRNIRVNAVVPGAIVTERQAALHRDAAADQAFLDAQCLKISLDPGHVARPTLFLAADDSDGITGQHVLVDAGIAQQSVIS
jgi:NAD(P)-dependent dehydrogenase (short-subunit alcohol dehydrogenase family)